MLFSIVLPIASLICFSVKATSFPTCTSEAHCHSQLANIHGTTLADVVNKEQEPWHDHGKFSVGQDIYKSAKLAPLVYKRVNLAAYEQGKNQQYYARENNVKKNTIQHTPAGLEHLKVAKIHQKVADKHYAAAISHLKAGNRKAANESERLGDAHARLAFLHKAVANELHAQ
ncbi:hypothetical protein HYPSUDRAFT_47014 [Hypholoma sublateritium FD-334 SS-4]|uniref:DUF1771 domain-containing protein n=1 Tax=Hypholoma sublateritium (strain FD-334 SS-4) TaxID=945553 RepID=A0A0D2NCC0_HYPSF|nr:hypothetical protein HYPSUDRAFT_47014 [Hypholoma sublateritium FD-334 SS-4]